MRRITEIPLVGSVFAFGADLLLFSGETIIAVVMAVGSTFDLWVPMLSYLSRVAEVSPLIPESPVETALLVGSIILVVYYGSRIVRRIITNVTET